MLLLHGWPSVKWKDGHALVGVNQNVGIDLSGYSKNFNKMR